MLFRGDSRKGQGKFNVFYNRLMRNEVVALKYETYRMITVNVPVLIGIKLRAFAFDDEIARSVAVKPADNVQKRGFSAARRTENGNELAFSERDVYAFQCLYRFVLRVIFFNNSVKFQHKNNPRIF